MSLQADAHTKVETILVSRVLKLLPNIIHTYYIVLNILVTKVNISQQKGLGIYYVSKRL